MNRPTLPDDDHPYNRVIPIIRITGLAMAIVGGAIAFGIGDILSPEIGIVIAAFGLIEMIAVPAVLQKVMNSRRQNELMGNPRTDQD